MSNAADSTDDDQLGLTEETLDQWENELDEFVVQIMQRLHVLSDNGASSLRSDERDAEV